MSHTPHELRDEFPEFEARIHALKESDGHFRKLADEYHAVNREVHRIEIGVEHLSPTAAEDVRKTRMRLKDEIYSMLKSG
jgi:uncharacterized protein YdcH (DUF465 family)